ncbi:MAG: membrane protein insertase YidC [Jatrophihabitantaceae bacterium]
MFHLDPLYTAVGWVLVHWHFALTALGLPYDSGVTWTLSIGLLVITVRLLLFRFFLGQLRHQRTMSALQPRLAAIRRKHGTDRTAPQREMLALQRAEGFNPVAGCLPTLLQIPIFLALVHLLRHVAGSVSRAASDPHNALYGLTSRQTLSAAHARLFGAPLAASLHDGTARIHVLLGTVTGTHVVVGLVVVISAAATYCTQRLIKSANPIPLEGTAATVQRVMRYAAPLSVLGSALFFPLGVLLYWCTSNLWTLGQQGYVERFHPHPAPQRP